MSNTRAISGDETVTIYTDGACRGNPGRGGWAAILLYRGHSKELSGGERLTTNNRMELTAAIRGLEALRRPCKIKLYSDSKYLIDAITQGWAVSWRAKGWRKGDKSEAKNPDLWGRLLDLIEGHEIEWIWVKGHAGNIYNERCDRLATGEADRFAEE